MGFVADDQTPVKKVGFVPDPEPATAGPSPLMAPVGGAELLLHHLTGALAPVPGMIAGSGAAVGKLFGANVDPQKVQSDTENALTYQPQTDSGKAGLATERAIVEPVVKPVVKPVTQVVDSALAHTGAAEPYVRAAGKGALTAAGLAAPLESAVGDAVKVADISALSPAERAAFQAREGTSTAAPPPATGGAKPVVGTGADAIQTGRSAGFKFTPGAVESRMPEAEVPSSAGVTPNDRRAINLHNQGRVTELAGEQIGKPGAKTLAPKDYDEARKPHAKTYEDTGATLGSGLTGSQTLQDALAARLADQTQTALKAPVAAQAQRILKAASSGNLSGPQLVKDISWMRANGGRSVAKLLEDEMETQLGANSPQLEKFRNARTGFAQIKNLQDVTQGGQIDAGALARLDQKNPGLLTGNLKLIAQTAAAAPQDFRLPSGVVPGSSPISKPTLLGAATSAGKAALKLAAPGKFAPQSEAFQNRFGRVGNDVENSYRPDLGKRPAPPSKAFGLEAPPGSAAVPPRQGAMALPQGPPAAPKLTLEPPEGTTGVMPVQLGMQIAQGRPLEEQHLMLRPTEPSLEPHQPSLLGHEGTPEGGGARKPKAKKRGKD
jgi:hypothetical protein